jgi:hypothetical protein
MLKLLHAIITSVESLDLKIHPVGDNNSQLISGEILLQSIIFPSSITIWCQQHILNKTGFFPYHKVSKFLEIFFAWKSFDNDLKTLSKLPPNEAIENFISQKIKLATELAQQSLKKNRRIKFQ